MKVVPQRLQPGDDLRRALEVWMGEQWEQASTVPDPAALRTLWQNANVPVG
jgi:hypothetical protein